MSDTGRHQPRQRSRMARLFRRGPWENGATVLIALGVAMLLQPFSLEVYSNALGVILAGTLGFLVVSHFPE
jgi:hypothetical protein